MKEGNAMEGIEVLPIRIRVTAILRKALLSGEFARGQELSLTDVAASLGVSRTPVREAFQALAAEGLLDLRMNRGAVVVGIDEKFIQDHFELRALLETQAIRLAAARGIDIEPLLVLQQEAESRELTAEEYRTYNQKLHTAVWQAADNRRMQDFLLSLWNGPSGSSVGRDLEHEARSMAEHRQMLELLAAGKGEEAAAVMETHITRSMQNILHSFRDRRGEDAGC